MYRCVYSTDLTSKDVEPFLERLPYFNAVSRLTKYGHEETRKIKMKEEEWQQIIAFREADLQVSYRKSLALKYYLVNLDKSYMNEI